jgi:hypothetical protein
MHFRDHTRYELVRIDTKPSYDIGPFKVEAQLEDGRTVYLRTFGNTLFVTVPEFVARRKPRVILSFSRLARQFSARQAQDGGVSDEKQPKEEKIPRMVRLDQEAENSQCKLAAEYVSGQQINDSGSIDAPIREWNCWIVMNDDRPSVETVRGVAVTLQ